MTEVERARDAALVALLHVAAKHADDADKELLMRASGHLIDESDKQDDEDRNGVRRVMGKKDCVEATHNESPATPRPSEPPPKDAPPDVPDVPTAGEAKAAERITHCEEPNTSCGTCKVRGRCDVSGRKQD